MDLTREDLLRMFACEKRKEEKASAKQTRKEQSKDSCFMWETVFLAAWVLGVILAILLG